MTPEQQTVERFVVHRDNMILVGDGNHNSQIMVCVRRNEDYERLEKERDEYQAVQDQAVARVEDLLAHVAKLQADLAHSKDCHGTTAYMLAKEQADNKALREALRKLIRGYVSTLESARDRIRFLGGTCDSISLMEINDPHLIEARAALAAREETNG